ncbi:DHH family phosphoesterase [Corynebacterium aquilae]|uniref:Exopolyphosphatase n=1 Tax=Corynebacterium aquilae DSM 44791 TaxID=1431546 RepID=A0A1L7CGJ1_9CORY|nr:DHH family phosphoesterase [Corynebacterium aquilae]APT84956.1 hypothetical protein CAQU_07605 [Corynebacterium aquilae DSM 44791]
MLFEQATGFLAGKRTAAVVTHIRPDGDAIGSASATIMLLAAHGIDAAGYVGQYDEMPAPLRTLPLGKQFHCTDTLPDVDLIVVVDCGSLARTGLFEDHIRAHADRTLIIDHHASNACEAQVNVVCPEIESTCSLIWQWYQETNTEITAPAANAMMGGLLTDTAQFRYGRPAARDIAADLVKHGADEGALVHTLIDAISAENLQRIGAALAGLSIHQMGQKRVVTIEACDMDIPTLERIVDFTRGIDDADLIAVLKRLDQDTAAVSLRSQHLDVSRIAAAGGGGGHRNAAGFTVHGWTMADLREFLAQHLDD